MALPRMRQLEADLCCFHQELVPAAIVCLGVVKLLSLILCLQQLRVVGLVCAGVARGHTPSWLQCEHMMAIAQFRAHCGPTAAVQAWKRL